MLWLWADPPSCDGSGEAEASASAEVIGAPLPATMPLCSFVCVETSLQSQLNR